VHLLPYFATAFLFIIRIAAGDFMAPLLAVHRRRFTAQQAYKESEDMFRQAAAKFRFAQEHAMAIRRDQK
jgi:hypothetical protein